MASFQSLDQKAQALVGKSYPAAKQVDGDAVNVSSEAFPNAEYSQAEKTEIEQWLITSSHIASPSEDAAKTSERLSSLNTHLSTRTTLLGSKPSIADVALYSRLAPVVSSWTPEQRTGPQGHHHIVRHLDFVQNSDVFALKIEDNEKVIIDPTQVLEPIKPIDPKAEKERKKKEKEALAAAGATGAAAAGATVTSAADPNAQKQAKTETTQAKVKETGEKIAAAVGVEVPGANANTSRKEKKEKKEKAPKPAKAAPVEKPLSPCMIDLRVGHILKAERHPNADSLYVSTIACGDQPGTDNTSEYEGQVVHTVCSGLNGLIPLEDMQNRKIVAVCNLKPVTMRGIKSCAMVLAASPRLAEGEEDHHAGPVELVNIPAASVAGDRVYFEGWEGEPEPVLNPKKKQWETFQPGFTTTEGKEVAFDAGVVTALGKTGVSQLRTKDGICTVNTLTNATVR